MYMFVYEGGRGGVKILEKMATWFVHDPLVHTRLAQILNTHICSCTVLL